MISSTTNAVLNKEKFVNQLPSNQVLCCQLSGHFRVFMIFMPKTESLLTQPTGVSHRAECGKYMYTLITTVALKLYKSNFD